MKLYSFNGEIPKILPSRVRLENGQTRTSLNELSDAELEELGFYFISVPEYSEDTQEIQWNSTTRQYDILDLSEEIILKRKKDSINLRAFGDFLIDNFGETIRSCGDNHLCDCLNDLVLNLLTKNETGMKDCLILLFLLHSFSTEEKQKIFNEFQRLELNLLFDFPTEEEISKYSYDRNLKKLILPQPYPSWTLVNGDWTCPVTDPIIIDEENPPSTSLVWDESTLSWSFE